MKISELTNKSFLGAAGAAANSYVLINYEDNATNEPVTYKATLQELGKAIANDQQLYKKTVNGAITTSVSNGAYANGTAENLVTTTEKEMIEKMRYYVTNDSMPHLELTGANPTAKVEVITTDGYTDSNYISGRPVLYDDYNDALKYINTNGSLTTLALDNDGGGDALPTNSVYVVETSDGYEFYNPSTDTSTPLLEAIYPSGTYKIIFDTGDYEFKITEPANESDIPRTFAEVVALDGFTSYDGLEGAPIFFVQDSTTETTYLAYGSVGSSSELIPVANLAYITTSNGSPAICDASGHIVGLLTSPD